MLNNAGREYRQAKFNETTTLVVAGVLMAAVFGACMASFAGVDVPAFVGTADWLNVAYPATLAVMLAAALLLTDYAMTELRDERIHQQGQAA